MQGSDIDELASELDLAARLDAPASFHVLEESIRNAGQHPQSHTFYLILGEDEHVRWRQPGMVSSRARRAFQFVNTPYNVARAIRHAVDTEEHGFPIENLDI